MSQFLKTPTPGLLRRRSINLVFRLSTDGVTDIESLAGNNFLSSSASIFRFLFSEICLTWSCYHLSCRAVVSCIVGAQCASTPLLHLSAQQKRVGNNSKRIEHSQMSSENDVASHCLGVYFWRNCQRPLASFWI
ncbi:hypothetical protein GWK47_049875 [Chionoecetes opilio]|uniref:Uncharacterized protein n=1 Tax=Chionoecetes opilio TaxID=41210 RepID=A0A8J4Y9N4_CHIOP|nr:hypothetical protein GWK47_049875 [Chionoecetes opilio]